MNNRKLLVLSIVAAVSVLLAIIQTHISKPGPVASSAGASLIQGLEPASIGSIVIGTDENAVKLVRKGKVFVVGNKEDYPAETSRINKLIMACFDVQTLELTTGDPRNHEQLEVTPQKAKSIVKFLDKDGKLITGIIIGKTDSQTKVTYARLVSSSDVYSVTKTPTVKTSAMDYIDKDITNIETGDVVRATLTGPEGSFTIRTDANDTVVIDEMPEGKKLKTSDAKNVLGALSNLSFSDVKKESSFGKDELKFDNVFVCELKNSTVYTFDIATVKDKTYARCSAEYTADMTNIIQEKGKLKTKETKLLARDAALDFTDKHKGWVYEIPHYKVENLTKKLSELLEEPKKEEKAESPKADEAKTPAVHDANETPRIQ